MLGFEVQSLSRNLQTWKLHYPKFYLYGPSLAFGMYYVWHYMALNGSWGLMERFYTNLDLVNWLF